MKVLFSKSNNFEGRIWKVQVQLSLQRKRTSKVISNLGSGTVKS